jgi:hypothetical protein
MRAFALIARPVGDRDHVAHALLDLVHFAYSSFDLHWSIGIADYPRPIIGPECQWRDNTSSVEARPAGDVRVMAPSQSTPDVRRGERKNGP